MNDRPNDSRHYDTPGHAHELTFCCFHNQDYLSDERACVMLLEEIRKAQEQHAFHLWAYVIMPNHVHMLLWPTEMEYSIARILGFKGRMAIRYSRMMRESAPEKHKRYCVRERGRNVFAFWQRGGGFDRNLWNTDAVHASLRYIEQNPVKKGLVSAPWQWRWSSAFRALADEAFRPKVDRSSLPAKMV